MDSDARQLRKLEIKNPKFEYQIKTKPEIPPFFNNHLQSIHYFVVFRQDKNKTIT